ncbi:hypothetical protein MMC22_003892 [Lobaria immixta]|nr:hypothetical protein [Lobaria immixta]
MSDFIFEATPPRPSSPLGKSREIDFTRHPSMLTHFQEKSGLSFNTVAQETLESIPIRGNTTDDPFVASTEPVNENGKLWIRLPLSEHLNIGRIVENSQKQQDDDEEAKRETKLLEEAAEPEVETRFSSLLDEARLEAKTREADMREHFTESSEATKADTQEWKNQIEELRSHTQEWKNQIEELRKWKNQIEELKSHTQERKNEIKECAALIKELQIGSRRVERSRFIMFRANLLTAVVKKLSAGTHKKTPDKSPEGSKDAVHKGSGWAQLAESFDEAEVKKATQDFKISQNSKAVVGVLKKYSQYVKKGNAAAHKSEYEMAELLMSPSYHQTDEYYLWGELMEYVYGKTVERMVEEVTEEDEIEIVIPE